VVGAGPAGLECAVTLAREGRLVEIFEAATRLGGTLATTASAPHRSSWGSLIGYYEALVRRLPITLHLGVEANASAIDGFGEIVLATGAEEIPPDIPGGTLAQTANAALAVIVVGERRARPLPDVPAAARVHAIGDCVVPRRVSHAISEARACAAQILAGLSAPLAGVSWLF
jgi:NADPH-dependent glutamate synthase beta subunit-like oxidoreductase